MLTERQGILSNLRWLAISNLAVKPFWLAFLLLSARLLGPEEFGHFMYVLAVVSVVAVLLEGGIDVLTIRTLSTRPDEFSAFILHSSLLKVISGVAVGVVVVGLYFILGLGLPSLTLIIGAIVYSFFNSLMIHARFVFRGFEIMKLEAYSIFLEKLAVIAVGTAILLHSPDAETFMLGYAAAYLVACVGTVALVSNRIGWVLSPLRLRFLITDVLRPAIPYALVGVFMTIYFRSGTLMLEWLTGQKEFAGYYNAGFRLVEAFVLLPSIVVNPMYATFARGNPGDPLIESLISNATRILCAVALAVSIPLVVFHEGLTLLLFGADYSAASLSVGILALSMVPLGLTWVFGSLAAAVGRQTVTNYFILGSTVLNLVLLYVLIPRYGVIGAAFSTVLTEYILAFSCMMVVRDFFHWRKLMRLLGKLVLPGIFVLIPQQLGLMPSSVVLSVAVSLLVFFILYWLLRIIGVDDLRKAIGWT